MQNKIRIRVYQKVWGGDEMSYVRYFNTMDEALAFSKETGFRIEEA